MKHAEERRRRREREILGEEAYELTHCIHKSVVSLMSNVYELDYGELMKLRSSVREWTGKVDHVMDRLRKELC